MGLSKCFDIRDELGYWNCVRVALGAEGRMEEWLGAGPVAGGLFSLSCMGVWFGGDYALPGATESYRTPAGKCGPAAAVPAGGVEELGLCLVAGSRCACGLCPASLTLSLYWVGLTLHARALRYGGRRTVEPHAAVGLGRISHWIAARFLQKTSVGYLGDWFVGA